MIEAEWLGGPEDGKVLALPDGTQEVQTAVLPPFDWAKENVDALTPTEVVTLTHWVIRRSGKWYIKW